MNQLSKIWAILSAQERRKGIALIFLLLIGMAFELLGVGLILPVLVIASEPDLAGKYPIAVPLLEFLGNPPQEKLLLLSLIALVAFFVLRSIYLGFLAWVQTRYVFGVRLRISQGMFATYLSQPYIFHVVRNSSTLIRNVTAECLLFSNGALSQLLQVIADSFVLIGVSAFLLWYQPIGSISALVVLGGAAFGLQKFTGKRSTRWGSERQVHEGKRFQHLLQGLGGIKDIKLLGRSGEFLKVHNQDQACLLYTSPSPRDATLSRMPSSA